ncbi:MAG: class III extradiol ring-cleavage dioxygenase [Candidatus Heimdallarchaeota archaeon]
MSTYETSIYVGHGAPTVAIDPELKPYKSDLKKFGTKFSQAKSIVVVSAHWQDYFPIQVTSSKNPGIIYDFYGFPQEMYELTYEFQGNPVLANKIIAQLSSHGVNAQLNNNQGIDHGAWIPLREMYPTGNIPILQMSIPVPRTPDYLYKIGKILAPLREEGVMFMGSGNVIHNLQYVMYRVQEMGGLFANIPVESWAAETDGWLKERLDNLHIENLLSSPDKMPNFKRAAPTTEHFDPLYFILGTLKEKEMINHFHESFQMGSISMRSFHSES